ncbi:glycosyltransferase family 4 protein [Serratia fonticola]|uniref:glycosyltransferase family 4 protein n=1 Tax=Serratia fonticola TaxID=47917 RepID=UPI001AE0F16F|nr:glycosyltransferase family 4 protein [Serratia fonticola]MBP1035273.1 glycosyltransferase family 4 protein [Serratia fonticola]
MNNNLLFIVSSLKRGGPINQLWELLNNKNFIGDHSILSLSSLDLPGSRRKDFEQLGVKLYSLNYNGQNFYRLSREILSFINKKNFYRVISQGFRSDISVAMISKKLASKPCAILHNYIYSDYSYTYGFLRALIMTFCHVRALRAFDIIAVSESVRDFARKKYSLKSTAIRNGVVINPRNGEQYSNLTENRAIRLIYVGVIDKRKNVMKLLEAFKRVKRSDIELLVVGDGPLKNFLHHEDDSRVKYLGQRNDVNDLLLTSDFFVSASSFEGMPMAALEAIASGLPCILSDISPHRELISLSGNFGCVTDYDTCNLSKHIDSLISISRFDILSDFSIYLSSDLMARRYSELIFENKE